VVSEVAGRWWEKSLVFYVILSKGVCLRDSVASICASPAHQDHGEGHGGDDEADEAKGSWIGVSFDVVAGSLDLGREVKL
jgi:hypothetical protein